jgi:DNA-directed RNA polymerase specialized sigma24 family protein
MAGSLPLSLDLDALAERAGAGDGAAEAALFADLSVRLADIAKRRIRADEVDDCVQDTLRVVHRKYRTRPARVGILPWSFAVLRRVIGNVYRRRARAAAREGPEAQAAALASPEFDPLAAREAAALRRRVADAIERLEREHARCGRLFRVILASLARGDGEEEAVASAMSALRDVEPALTRGNFHVILHRCRNRLRQAMEGTRPT